MSDLSTREQIHAQAAHRISRALCDLEARPLTLAAEDWEALPSAVRDRYRRFAEALVDALGDLLPTGIEWGVYLDGVAPPNPFPTVSESTARSLLDTQDDHVVRKYTHDWIEVTE